MIEINNTSDGKSKPLTVGETEYLQSDFAKECGGCGIHSRVKVKPQPTKEDCEKILDVVFTELE